MFLFEDRDDWQRRVERFRRWSTLLGEDDTMAPLRTLVLQMEQQRDRLQKIDAAREELMRHRSVLLGEIDTLLERARGNLLSARARLLPSRFDPEDIREESRLCREEARSAEELATRRSFASRSLELAMLGEKVARDGGS